jgi:uncharacterized protein (DUF1015 family)
MRAAFSSVAEAKEIPMADIRPFAAVMPPRDKAPKVAEPPYDVMSADEARRLAEGNPLSFLRVARAELELPADTNPYAEAVYEQALRNYRRLCREVPLTPDARPRYYVYSLLMNRRRQTGVVAAAAVDDYDSGLIRRHEKTRQDKEDDRTRHILTLRSQTGPVFLTYRDSPAVDTIVTRAMGDEPVFDFVARDGIHHTGWRIADRDIDLLRRAFAEVPRLYIADGHHRAAGASRVRALLRQRNPAHSGREEYNAFLSVIFPAGQLRILPYNRVVVDLQGRSQAAFREALAQTPFRLAPAASATPAEGGTVHMFLEGHWWSLTFSGNRSALSPTEQLDVSLLQNHVLGPLLGIDDPRTSKRIDFVGGIRGTGELERRVASGTAAVAFSMFPATLEQLMAISDAEQIMPPKSTWFEPKLRDGLFVHDI